MLPAQLVRGRTSEWTFTLVTLREDSALGGGSASAGGFGPGGRQGGAVPLLDDLAGDRYRRRQRDLAGLDRGQQLVPAEPVRLGDLLAVHRDVLAGRGVGAEAEHQAARHRP